MNDNQNEEKKDLNATVIRNWFGSGKTDLPPAVREYAEIVEQQKQKEAQQEKDKVEKTNLFKYAGHEIKKQLIENMPIIIKTLLGVLAIWAMYFFDAIGMIFKP